MIAESGGREGMIRILRPGGTAGAFTRTAGGRRGVGGFAINIGALWERTLVRGAFTKDAVRHVSRADTVRK